MGNTVKKEDTSDYSALLAQYKEMQTIAFQTQSVKAPMLDELKSKLDAYLVAHVTDPAELKKKQTAIDSTFDVMNDAVALKESTQKTSDPDWDSATADMHSMLTDLAPEGSDEEVFDPTAAFVGGAGGNSGAQYKSLLATGGLKVDASGADMTGVEEYLKQNPAAQPYLDMVKQASVSYTPHTPVRVLLAQINAESSFNPNAVGKFGEQGLTQFTHGTWEAMGMGDYSGARDPQTAINAQAKYMAQLQEQNGGNLAWALESYNGWERDKSYDYNVGKSCSPTYVQDATGMPYDQRKDSTG